MFDHLLAVDGCFPDEVFFKENTFNTILATDGAALKLKRLGLEPTVIIGDMDTLLKQTPSGQMTELNQLFPRSEIIRQTDQDTTDFEKSLAYLVSKQIKNLDVIGLFGGDLDHAFYNARCFGQYAPRLGLRFFHQEDTTKAQWGIVIHQDSILNLPIGTKLSLLPLEDAQLSTRGLKWELSDSILTLRGHVSVRNETQAESVHVHIKKGSVLCLIHLKVGIEPVLSSI